MAARVVVFGGSFDPVHDGHLAMADAVQSACAPGEVLWTPARQAPHKSGQPPAPAGDRAAFLRLALAERPGERLCTRELERPGPSYAVDTLAELAAERPGAELGFLAGADSLAHLSSWRDPAGLFRLARFLFVPRRGWGADALQRFREGLDEPLRALFRADWIPMREVAVSSTELRAALAAGEAPSGMPAAVAREALRRGSYSSVPPSSSSPPDSAT